MPVEQFYKHVLSAFWCKAWYRDWVTNKTALDSSELKHPPPPGEGDDYERLWGKVTERASATPSGCPTKEEASSLGKLTLEVGLKRKVSLQHGEEDRIGRRVHKSKGMEMCECFLRTSVVLEKQQMRLARQLPQGCKGLNSRHWEGQVIKRFWGREKGKLYKLSWRMNIIKKDCCKPETTDLYSPQSIRQGYSPLTPLWCANSSSITVAGRNDMLELSAFVTQCMHAKSLQSCPTLCDPVDCSQPGSSVHGFLQARILEWIAMPSSRGSSRPRNWTHVSLYLVHWQAGSWPLAPPGNPSEEEQKTDSLIIWARNEGSFGFS